MSQSSIRSLTFLHGDWRLEIDPISNLLDWQSSLEAVPTAGERCLDRDKGRLRDKKITAHVLIGLMCNHIARDQWGAAGAPSAPSPSATTRSPGRTSCPPISTGTLCPPHSTRPWYIGWTTHRDHTGR